MKGRLIMLLTVGLLSAVLLAGCGGSTATTAKPAGATTATTAAGETTATTAPEKATITTAAATTTTGKPLSATIVLPAGWEMKDAISVAEIEAIVGKTGYKTWAESLSDAKGGKPQGSYFDGNLAASKLNFLVYTKDGKSNYDRVAGFVENPNEVPGPLWDKAVIGEMMMGADRVVGMLILRGDVCMRIQWDPTVYSSFDRTELSVLLADLLVNNLYGGK
jgi:hypothetical protein